MQDNNQLIMDKYTRICLCKGITKATFKKAIDEGKNTVSQLRAATGAGSGACKGRRCTPKIKELLEEYKEK